MYQLKTELIRIIHAHSQVIRLYHPSPISSRNSYLILFHQLTMCFSYHIVFPCILKNITLKFSIHTFQPKLARKGTQLSDLNARYVECQGRRGMEEMSVGDKYLPLSQTARQSAHHPSNALTALISTVNEHNLAVAPINPTPSQSLCKQQGYKGKLKNQDFRDGGFHSNSTNDFAQEYQPPLAPPDPHPTPAKSAELEGTHCKSEDLKPPYDIHNWFSKDRNKNLRNSVRIPVWINK